jgi:hypothetical protein
MVTADRLAETLREHMPTTLGFGGLCVNETGLGWLLPQNGKPQSKRSLREWREAGYGPPGVKLGGAWWYDLEDVAAWIEAQKRVY